MIGSTRYSIVPPERISELEQLIEKIRRGERTEHFETQRFHRDGHRIDVSISMSPLHDATGTVVATAAILRDISAQKDALRQRKLIEEKLAMHARRQTAVAELGLVALTDIAIENLLSASVELVANELGVEAALLPEPSESPSASTASTGEARSPVARVVVPGRDHANGVLLAFSNRERSIADDELTFLQAIANVAGAAIDRKAATDALLRRKHEFEVLVEHASDNIVRVDREGRFMYLNPAAERIIGMPASRLVGQSTSRVPPMEPATTLWDRAVRRVFRTGEEDELEMPYPTPIGERYFHVRLSPEFGPDGTVNSVLGVGRDVTVNKQREAERAQHYQELLERDSRLHQLLERVLLNQSVSNRHRQRALAAADQFTPREREILRLLARGYTNREIGREINLRASTVKNYVANLLPRLNATDRTQAAVHAAVLGLVDTGESE